MKTNKNKIRELAERQGGYFTTFQAHQEGIPTKRINEMFQRGLVERVDYGLYRDLGVPTEPLDKYHEATLWPHTEVGTIIGETALRIYNVCDVNPHKIDLAVTKNYKTTRLIPDNIVLVKQTLTDNLIRKYKGVKIVILAEAVRQAFHQGVETNQLQQAIINGKTKGLINNQEMHALLTDLSIKITNEEQRYHMDTIWVLPETGKDNIVLTSSKEPEPASIYPLAGSSSTKRTARWMVDA